MESINLNLIPQGANPVVHAKQFDEGRGFRFNLFNGTAPIVLTGAETITCNVKKPDGNLVTVAVTNTSSNYVEVYTTLQMCACYGANLGEIRLEEDGNDIGTLNFTLSVEESPLNNGIESESSIHNLESMVDEMVAEEVATQYDSANVIFDAEPTENHGIGYTVTSEGIKTAIDNAFDYDNTASGSLVHITDGADNIPVKSLTSEIVAVETGNGQPKSPDNPYTISGFDSGVVSVCGKNLLSISNIDFTLKSVRYFTSDGNFYLNGTSTGETSSRDESFRTNLNFLLKAGTYYFSRGNLNIATYLYDYEDNTKPAIVTNSGSFTITEDTRVYIGFYVYNQTFNNLKSEIMVNVGSSATTYEAYNGNTYTFTFGQTVFGGYFDNKGNAVVTYKGVDLGSLSWTRYNASGNYVFFADISDGRQYATQGITIDSLCEIFPIYPTSTGATAVGSGENKMLGFNSASTYTYTRILVKDDDYTSASDFRSAVSGKYLTYELANPITLAITSQDIPTLLGENNIYSNCGDLEVNYYTSKSNDILEFVNAEIGKKNGTNIPIEENSQDSIKTYVDNEVSSTKDYIDNGLSGKEDSITYESDDYNVATYGGVIRCKKWGRMVNIQGYGLGTVTNMSTVQAYTMATIASKYCPTVQQHIIGSMNAGSYATSSVQGYRINTDGTVATYVYSGTKIENGYFNVTYMV